MYFISVVLFQEQTMYIRQLCGVVGTYIQLDRDHHIYVGILPQNDTFCFVMIWCMLMEILLVGIPTVTVHGLPVSVIVLSFCCININIA